MKMKKLTTFALAAALAIGTFGISVPAKAAENSTDYTITIPATLSVANAGWNTTEGITAQVKSGDTFDTSKKLTVTAASANSWALKSGGNSIGYNLATASADYSATATPASWEFSADELDAASGTNKAMGINVQDYTTMAIPAGEYKDTVTFTAKVETAKTTLADALKNGATLEVMCASNNNVKFGGNFTYNDGVFTLNNKVGDTDDFGDMMKANASVSGTTITINTGFTSNSRYDHTVTLNTSDNSYTLTGGALKGSVMSVKVNGEEILNDLTKN